MKKAKKGLLLALCAVLLVGATIAGTVAYLTSVTTEVKNTFTVGHVMITLDEKDVDKDTNTADNVGEGTNVRDKANAYLLVPGVTYEKDPTVHVQANSENSWVFVKVENGLVNYEGETTIHDQILKYGWKVLNAEEYPGVYYQSYTKTDTDTDIPVFATFTIANTNKQGADWSGLASKNITVTAYAIQKANGTGEFTAADAWNALNS